jgi:hypothetical protein
MCSASHRGFELELELGIGEAETKYWTYDSSYVSFLFSHFPLSFAVLIDVCGSMSDQRGLIISVRRGLLIPATIDRLHLLIGRRVSSWSAQRPSKSYGNRVEVN